jgi:hypothetical protein
VSGSVGLCAAPHGSGAPVAMSEPHARTSCALGKGAGHCSCRGAAAAAADGGGGGVLLLLLLLLLLFLLLVVWLAAPACVAAAAAAPAGARAGSVCSVVLELAVRPPFAAVTVTT